VLVIIHLEARRQPNIEFTLWCIWRCSRARL